MSLDFKSKRLKNSGNQSAQIVCLAQKGLHNTTIRLSICSLAGVKEAWLPGPVRQCMHAAQSVGVPKPGSKSKPNWGDSWSWHDSYYVTMECQKSCRAKVTLFPKHVSNIEYIDIYQPLSIFMRKWDPPSVKIDWARLNDNTNSFSMQYHIDWVCMFGAYLRFRGFDFALRSVFRGFIFTPFVPWNSKMFKAVLMQS